MIVKDEADQIEACLSSVHMVVEEIIITDCRLPRESGFYGWIRMKSYRKKNWGLVGGLGACTLIRRKALLAGVSFKQLSNLSFWGEDRHFCIRAQALGLSLFVDTHHPAFHLYRESDFAEARIWMKQIYGSAPLRVKTTRPPVVNNTIPLGN